MESLKGKFLVATKKTNDPMFSKSVILMMEHGNNEGATGIIINGNRSGTLHVDDLGLEIPTFYGGPVHMENIVCVHGHEDIEHVHEIIPGVFIARIDTLDEILKLPVDDRKFKLLNGISGWVPMQLESEISNKAWTHTDASFDQVFHTEPRYLWESISKVEEVEAEEEDTGGYLDKFYKFSNN